MAPTWSHDPDHRAATARLAASATPLDVLLVDAARPLHRFLPDLSTVKWAVSRTHSDDRCSTAGRAGG